MKFSEIMKMTPLFEVGLCTRVEFCVCVCVCACVCVCEFS
jgi:hypothetical protein